MSAASEVAKSVFPHFGTEFDGWDAGDGTLTTVGEGERFEFTDGQAVAISDTEGGLGSQQVRMMLRRLVRLDYQYVLLTMMASLIATIGLIGDLPIAIVGAMAFSPNLGCLNAMGFAILIRDSRLLLCQKCQALPTPASIFSMTVLRLNAAGF